MNNFTFKNLVLALLTIFSFQFFSHAQHEEQPNTARDGQTYRIKNKATGKYFAYDDVLAALVPKDLNASDINQIWEFKSNTIAVTGSTYYTIDLGGTAEGTRGIIRLAGSGSSFEVYSTTKKSSDTSGISDKVQNVHELGNNEVRIQAKTSNQYLRENTEAEVNAATHTMIYTNPPLDENDDRQIWILEDGTLSAIEIAESYIFMSNPVKDNVSITGLTAEIDQVNVYSLLGAKVLSKEVNNASSMQLNVGALSKGMYIVDFVGQNGNFTKKLIKQ